MSTMTSRAAGAHAAPRQATPQRPGRVPAMRALRALGLMPGSRAVLLCALLLWLAHSLQALQAADAWLQHVIWRLAPQAHRSPQVLLIEIPYAQLHASLPALPALSAQWRQAGARAVAADLPAPVTGDIIQAGGAAGSHASTRQWLAQLAGVSQQQAHFLPDHAYRSDELPRIALARAQQEGIPSALLRDRVVLLGLQGEAVLRSYALPGQSAAVSALQYQGFLLDSLLQHGRIAPTGVWASGALLLLCGLLCCLVLQGVSLRLAGWLTLCSLPFWLALGALLLLCAKTWLPLSALILLGFATSFCVLQARNRRAEIHTQSLIANLSGKLQRMSMPPALIESDEHWQFLLRLLDQTLHVQCAILLEAPAKGWHLREVQAQGCALGAISELRRDYRRQPYAQALQSGALHEVRDFLGGDCASARQFVYALQNNGVVQGFLVFGVAAQQEQHFLSQQDALQAIAAQIAVLLSQRRAWLAQQARANAPWRQWFADARQGALQQLQQAVADMQARAQVLEQSLQQASHASILFDVFGRVLLINQAMRAHLQEQGLSPQGQGASGLLTQLAGKSREEVRLAMQDLILARRELLWPLAGRRSQVLRASALHAAKARADMPFALVGIQLEILDVSELALQQDASAEIRRQMLQLLHDDLRKLPALARSAISALQSGQGAARQLQLWQWLQHKTENLARLEQRSQLLLASVEQGAYICYPLDLALQCRQTLHNLAPQLQARSLTYAIKQSAPVYGFALPPALQTCLHAMLLALIADAAEESALQIEIISEGGRAGLHLHNQGFGMRSSRLQQGMQGNDPAFAALRSARDQLAQWDGALELDSAPGKGSRASLYLQAFDWLGEDADSLLAQMAKA
ncbi:hypothetical protein V8J88_08150 [Massilia sp. W12]|uniref:hypothetical protein n=1 Tax=Massilia sp. W12 TaxID=3126507 RepID=UPI0030CA724F